LLFKASKVKFFEVRPLPWAAAPVTPVSERFLTLLHSQLGQFVDCPDVEALVVYVTHPGEGNTPTLLPLGQWPEDARRLAAVGTDSQLRVPAEERRWLPLRDGAALLGALQVETRGAAWSPVLQQRLQGVAVCLTEALRLDLERQRLQRRVEAQEEQLRLLVHQLRNPLTALRTFGHLLLRRLKDDSDSRSLVEGLLAEERQLNKYVEAISALAQPDGLLPPDPHPDPLLLPPLLSGPEGAPLPDLVAPLLQRATATAALQGRQWLGPTALPPWQGDASAVAEILANLLENAFQYSAPGSPVGLHSSATAAGPCLTVWDGGMPIAEEEQERIFQRGVRGRQSQGKPGTGLGLALARDLARHLGGNLELVIPPALVDPELPSRGNAFRLSLPASPESPPASSR
jgi:signal transduction histidine kinase